MKACCASENVSSATDDGNLYFRHDRPIEFETVVGTECVKRRLYLRSRSRTKRKRTVPSERIRSTACLFSSSQRIGKKGNQACANSLSFSSVPRSSSPAVPSLHA